ncbi:IgGFc-binding protein-like isoform X2 [Haliotis rufescens]|uniref:IgGFc-binding protein-like isoform X2 n=1 Tax=Haliotis rufescens TaxID=6454 RepID=UPI00201F1BCD|nr:IgGFc-binding protein-like isoform X2 [Haliotis rufescens]
MLFVESAEHSVDAQRVVQFDRTAFISTLRRYAGSQQFPIVTMDKNTSLMIWWIVIMTGAVGGNHVGREFLIGFLEPFFSHNAKYFISITAQTTSTVIIKSMAFDIVEVVVVTENTSTQVDFLNSTFYHGDLEVTKETIAVISTGDISVSAYYFSDDASDGYLAIPVQSLSNTYIAVSSEIVSVFSVNFPLTNRSTSGIIIMSSADSNNVTISLKLPLGGSCGKAKHQDGKFLQFELQKNEMIGVQCSNDLTGTRIVSSKPVAVVSGSTRTEFPKGSKSSDRLMEMVIPVSAYGFNYVLHDLPGRSSGTVYRVVASEDTDVLSSSGSLFNIKAQEFVDIDTLIYGPQCISSKMPIMVVLFAKGTDGIKIPNNNLFMAIVPSIQSYSSWYSVNHNISVGVLLSNFVTVILPMDKAAGLRPSIFSQFSVLEGCCFAVASGTPLTAVYMIEHDAGIPFGLLTYGQSGSTAVGFPAGITFNQGTPCGKSGCAGTVPYPCTCVEAIPTYQCTDNSQGCNSSLCSNNSTCSAVQHAYQCQCMDGFGGAHCETDIVDDCLSHKCSDAQGVCVDAINSYICNCSAGFTGQQCEQNIDDCKGVVCKNNGTCIDGTNSYTCQCLTTFTGMNCDIDMDPCLSSPCKNSGRCISSGIDAFVCVCNNDYIGDVCQYDLTAICLNKSCSLESGSFNITSDREFNLTLDKRTLSQYIYRYVSYPDDRPSAKGLGYSGVMIIIAFVLCILLMDVDRLCRKPQKRKKKRKKMVEKAGPSNAMMPIQE